MQEARLVKLRKRSRPGEVAPVALEAEIGRLFIQMPLAGHGGEVAGGLQQFGQGDGPF